MTIESPVSRVLRENRIVELPDDCLLITRNGQEIPIADNSQGYNDGLNGHLENRETTRAEDMMRRAVMNACELFYQMYEKTV